MSKCALVGGRRVRSKPFAPWPLYDKKEEKLLLQVLKSRYWGGYPYPAPFYTKAGALFAKAHDARYGLPASNGTITLEIALRAAGIQPYDEVIVPPFTFVATAAAVLMAGAIPVFADVEDRNWCLDPEQVEQKITRRTRAIIPVHLGMNAADMDKLKKIARQHKLIIIEDCAHAHGGKWRSKGLGSLGDIGSFSFQSSKLLTSGEGGMLITNSARLRERMASIINCGRPSSTDRFKERPFGYNYRITEFQAAIMCAQISRLPKLTKKREANANYLERQLAGCPAIKLFARDKRQTVRHYYHYLLRFDKTAWDGVSRDLFIAALNAEGIPCDGLFYEPLYDSPLFQIRKRDFPQLKKIGTPFMKRSCPVAEKACYDEAIWLTHEILEGSRQDVDDVVRAIAKLYDNRAEIAPLTKMYKSQSRALRK